MQYWIQIEQIPGPQEETASVEKNNQKEKINLVIAHNYNCVPLKTCTQKARRYIINTYLSSISKGNEIKAIAKKEKYNPCKIRITIYFRLKAGVNPMYRIKQNDTRLYQLSKCGSVLQASKSAFHLFHHFLAQNAFLSTDNTVRCINSLHHDAKAKMNALLMSD